MKKRVKMIVYFVIHILVLLLILGFFWDMILPTNVERIELKTYDHQHEGKVELTKAEQWKLLCIFNLSRRAGPMNGEPCCDSYGFRVYFKNGRELYIGEGTGSKMIVRSPYHHYVKNQWLIDYIYELAEKYDLPID